MRFCTVVNCMDGRVQLPVIRYAQKRFNADYVDSITEPGPILMLSEGNHPTVRSIIDRLDISIESHNSVRVAVVGHHDCAGSPATKEDQLVQLRRAIRVLGKLYENVPIVGLWVDGNWQTHEVIGDGSSDQNGL